MKQNHLIARLSNEAVNRDSQQSQQLCSSSPTLYSRRIEIPHGFETQALISGSTISVVHQQHSLTSGPRGFIQRATRLRAVLSECSRVRNRPALHTRIETRSSSGYKKWRKSNGLLKLLRPERNPNIEVHGHTATLMLAGLGQSFQENTA